jgi:hypothetical protein
MPFMSGRTSIDRSALQPTHFIEQTVVREHQGQLIYEGSHRGAVFAVTLPPFPG